MKNNFRSTENTFLLKKNLTWFWGKCFSFYFGWKILFKSCEKFRNIILFADYIKFDLQIFNCYIFCLNFFKFYLLKFDLILWLFKWYVKCFLYVGFTMRDILVNGNSPNHSVIIIILIELTTWVINFHIWTHSLKIIIPYNI